MIKYLHYDFSFVSNDGESDRDLFETTNKRKRSLRHSMQGEGEETDMQKNEIAKYLESRAELFYSLSDKIWDHPETLFEEHVSSEALCQALEQEGFQVERNIAGMPTAFSARFGNGKPVIAFLGEFDALFGMSQAAGVACQQAMIEGGSGHGCGHNLLGTGSLAGAFGLKKYLEETGKEGTVIYFGCPAEEGGSGKAFMAREGCFNEVDCALTWHPSDSNAVVNGSTLANCQVYYRFKGTSAHAAASPHMGRSALDAVELMNVGVQFLREHVIQEARIHYAITNTGGHSPNVVQPNADVLYLIRAPKTPQVLEIRERVDKIARGAAMMTETEVEIEFVKGCSNTVPNTVLERMLYSNLQSLPKPQYNEEEMEFIRAIAGTVKSPAASVRQRASAFSEEQISASLREEILAKAEEPVQSFVMPYIVSNAILPASSDVGDASWNCPTAQFAAATWVAGTPAHTWQAVAVGKSASAHKATLLAGQVLAATAIDLLNDPEKIAAAKAELNARLSGTPYICPIPPEVKPNIISK